MTIKLTDEHMDDEIGIGIGVRLKMKGTLSEALTPKPPINEVYVYRDPELSWPAWWRYTKKLLAKTWRNFYGRFK